MYHARPFGGNPKLHNPPKIYQRTPATGTSGKRGVLQSKAMLQHLFPEYELLLLKPLSFSS